MLTGIVNMARELQLAVVVEGVETAEQLMLLRESRAPAAQGYFFSRPMTAARCGQMLRELDALRGGGESTTVRGRRDTILSIAS